MCTLDLHGTKHSEVISKLSRYLFWEKPGWSQYKIITGDSSKMRKIVIKWLEDHEYSYYIPEYNIGEIQVTDKKI